jgi:hypothetical protein
MITTLPRVAAWVVVAAFVALIRLVANGGGGPMVVSPLSDSGRLAVTVPMVLDHDRVTVRVQLSRAGSQPVEASAWIDTGGTKLVLAEPLARALGFDVSGLGTAGADALDTAMPAPGIRIGTAGLDTAGLPVSIRAGGVAWPGVRAACTLPARCLRRLRVVFDYPAKQFTVGPSGAMTPVGIPTPCRVNPETGLIMAEGVIDGEPVALGIDSGSAGTWVSTRLTSAWLSRHTDWPRAEGAAGSTNFFGFPFETRGSLLHLPALAIGAVAIRDVAVLGLMPELFEWYSGKSAGPVDGFVGGDVLARFRLEVDVPSQTCWWKAGPAHAWRDLDIVGLAIKADADGGYRVAGVVSRRGVPAVAGVQTGDRLLQVGSLAATGARMGDVIEALRGRPGDTRRLIVERAGRRLAIDASVVRLP